MASPFTIVLTGATDGIGLEMARYWSNQPVRLIVIGRRRYHDTPLACITSPDDYCCVDLSLPDADLMVSDRLRAIGVIAIDILAHNAAVGFFGDVGYQDDDAIDEMAITNLWAPIAITYRLLDLLQAHRMRPSDYRGASKNSRVLFVGSLAAYTPAPNFSLYAATKAGIGAFARNLRAERIPGVDVIVAHPGATRTNLHKKSGADFDKNAVMRMADARSVAKSLITIVEQGRRPHNIIGFSNRVAVFMTKVFPGLVKRLITQGEDSFLKDRRFENSDSDNNRRPVSMILGAAGGIGSALADEYDEYDLLLCDKNEEHLRTVMSGLAKKNAERTTRAFAGDLNCGCGREQILRIAKQAGGLDLIIIATGNNAVGKFGDIPLKCAKTVFEQNFTDQVKLLSLLLRHGLILPFASILLVSSLSSFTGYPGATVYAASKQAIASFAKNLSLALIRQRIGVFCLYPGPVETGHARTYSPTPDDSSHRMSATAVAKATVKEMSKRRMEIIPGAANRCCAMIGKIFPRLTDAIMKRSILDKIDKPLL